MRKILIIVLIIGVVVVSAIAISRNRKEEDAGTSTTQQEEVAITSGTGGTTTSTTGTKATSPSTGTSLPANTLVIVTPKAGDRFRVGELVNVTWQSSTDLSSENVKMIMTLVKDGKDIATLTEKGGTPANTGKFRWEVPNVSLWGEEGFSIKLSTTGLSRNLSAQSGTFMIVRPSPSN